MNYAERYRQMTEQRAYARRVRVHGLPALLAPHTISARVPEQRRAVPTIRAIHAV